MDALPDPSAAPDHDAPDDSPSKSQRKRDMHALQALGERLVELPASQLERIELPPELVDAIALARRVTAREGRRRQLQYVGKLMRRVDADAIRARLEVDDAQHRLETAVMHAAERWRDALIESPERFAEFTARHPGAARALHPLVRAARAEHAKQQRGRHYRELYRELREVLLADARPTADAGTPSPTHDA
ncbi:MAG: ribosome biogenesis factor YjgA [Burkholderiales bacterium]|jgi:ribosome-associated protein